MHPHYSRITMEERKKMGFDEILSIVDSNQCIREEMQHVWFSADHHDSHDKIIEICSRPTTVADHREWLIETVLNAHVGKKDKLYLLGDLSFGPRKEVESKFISKIRGSKTLILGNHDRNLRNSTYFAEITQRKNFTFSRGGLNIHIVLDHFPLASWDRKPYGSWHLHGHTHGRFVNHGLSWDVGIDNWRTLTLLDDTHINNLWKPISLYEVTLLMSLLYRNASYNISRLIDSEKIDNELMMILSGVRDGQESMQRAKDRIKELMKNTGNISEKIRMRKSASEIFELTKGFEGEPTDNAMRCALEMAHYVMLLTTDIIEAQ